ncbi:MAG: hydantoinase/oxoprolinase family protein, partial [Pseudomonadota bacterium]
QGLDPREFTLVAFGGAGPMAAAFLAEELEISEIIVPPFPGTFSAWGMLQTDLRQDLTRNFFAPASPELMDEMSSIYADLETDGRERILKEGVAESAVDFVRSADMRYLGQEYSINVPIATGASVEQCIDDFHAAHERRYGHANRKAPVEFVNLRVAVFGRLEKYRDGGRATLDEAIPTLATRNAVFGGATHETPVLARDRMPGGERYAGPAIIEEQSATTVVPPGWTAFVDDLGNLMLQRRAS